MTRHTPLLAFLAGVVICYMAVQLRAPDTTEADEHVATAADSLVAALAHRMVADSLARLDSLHAAEDEAMRARHEAERAADAARIREARAHASEVATDLVARTDSTETALFVSYQLERDSVEAAKDREIERLGAENAGLAERTELLAAQVTALRHETAAAMEGWAASRAEAEVLRSALRSQGTQNNVLRAVIGVGLAKAAYDFFSPDKGG
jgi:hypothetical protein